MNENIDSLKKHLPLFAGKTVLVIGDAMLDSYIRGSVKRISPEAPVPVVSVDKEYCRLGGAANVAGNIAKLGGRALLLAAVGDDSGAEQLKSLLNANNISTDSLVVCREKMTTVKTRVMANNQQIVRFDKEDSRGLAARETEALLAGVKEKLPQADAVILSDYRKGVLSEEVLRGLGKIFQPVKTFIAVDPKRIDFSLYKSVSLITPNETEARAALAARFGEFSEHLFKQNAEKMRKELNLNHLLITRSEKGMLLLGNEPVELRALSRDVFDPTGAGDTVIATVALAVAAGASVPAACALANIAAGYTVSHIGTTGPDIAELEQLLG